LALNKQAVNINFGKGIETKTDPNQLQLDSFLALHNSVFTTTNRLTKRNGFANITTLPNTFLSTNITTLNDNLIATGSNLFAFSEDTNQWYNKGITQPIQLSTLPIVRVSTSQQNPDAAIALDGLVCTAYIDISATGVRTAYYQVSDSRTGTQIQPRTALEAGATVPRVFLLGVHFVITYVVDIAGVQTLRYIAMLTSNIPSPSAPITISTSVSISGSLAAYDGFIDNNRLYLAWAATTTTVLVAFLTSALNISAPVTITVTGTQSIISITGDTSRIYVTYYDSGTANGFTNSFNLSLAPVMTATPSIVANPLVVLITSIVLNNQLQIFIENINFIPPLNEIRSDFISEVTVTPPIASGVGTVGPDQVVLRSVGLSSKPFAQDGTIYMLVAYDDENTSLPGTSGNSFQPSYFLMDGIGNIYMRLAYSNGGGYTDGAFMVLPTVSIVNNKYFIPYLVTDFLATTNKTTNPGQPTNPIFTQVGINLAEFTINNTGQYSSEIAGALHLTGGMLWEYDGIKPVEHGFHVWPENITFTTNTSGSLAAELYNYVFTYEWTDNVGNLHRSAPSVPLPVDLTSSGSSTNANILVVPTLRLTYKQPTPEATAAGAPTTNPVRIVGYRWSVQQQVYYQFTSLTDPIINDPTVDSVTITDTLADASILGNVILYTTGGVIEDIAAPASIASALFDNRLWLVDAEDQNLLWYSKQVIEAVPVEMSDLLTIYVAPTSGAQGSTGPVAALSAMDDKLLIFKKDAIYYINGIGPDNTGANSSYSDAIFITATVGTVIPNSIVLMPNGLMFQSDKGIWLLGRDLSTTYIGSPVEAFNNNVILSAKAIPATNQVRFILDNSTTLMYDYFQGQWGTHSNVLGISSTLYQGLHTYLNSSGQVYQETPGIFTDGSEPVLLSLTTAWINVAGLQGFERFYFGYLLGTYFTPFTLDLNIAYNYQNGSQQNIKISPDNYAPAWGGEALWGSGGPWGGSSSGNVFEARFFPQVQKCSSFQITIQEVYDASLGAPAGQGLSLSGLALVVGSKRGFRTQAAGRSFGSST
jgi:hypothetical protein